MKAAVLKALGEPVYTEAPEPDTTDPVIDVILAAINPFDMIYSRVPTSYPRVPGFEGVGHYEGRRVYFQSALGPHGSMAERASAKRENVINLPDNISDEMALVLGTTGLTAYLSLIDCAEMQPGETVLVLGASGIVGQIAVQIARHLRAGKVVGAARKVELLAELPVDAAVSLVDASDVEDLASEFRAQGKPDVTIDPLWGVPGLSALQAAAPRGRHVQLGHSAGASVNFSPTFMRSSGIKLLGFSSTIASPARRQEAYGELCQLAAAGLIKVPTEIMPLSAITEIWKAQASSPNRKLCIDVSR